LDCSDEIVNFIGNALKEGDLQTPGQPAEPAESADLLKKYNEILQSNLKARTQSILQKKLNVGWYGKLVNGQNQNHSRQHR